MANKFTLDFVENKITWDMITQQGTEFCPDLCDRKSEILNAISCDQIRSLNVDKIVMDFESETVIWANCDQQDTEYCPGLRDQQNQILEAMDYHWFDFTNEIDAINGYLNGMLSPDELLEVLSSDD